MLYVLSWMDDFSLLVEGCILLFCVIAVLGISFRKNRLTFIRTFIMVLVGALIYYSASKYLFYLEISYLWILIVKLLILFLWSFLVCRHHSISSVFLSASVAFFIYTVIGFMIDSIMIVADQGIHSLRLGYLRLMYNKELHHSRILIYLLVQPLCVILFRPFFHKLHTIQHRHQWFTALLCLILSILSTAFVVSVYEDNRNPSGIITILTWFLLILGIIMVITIFISRTESDADRHEYEMIRAMNHSLSSGYSLLADKNDELRIQAHDFRNHLLTLQRMNEKEAHAYIADLLKQQATSRSFVSTENRLLDAVLNSKIPLMQMNDIHFYHNIRMPGITGISQTDLCTIASNQLDNAIEACQKIENLENRWIRFTVDQGGDILSILCENSIVPHSVTMESLQTTSKSEARHLHGLGIRSIEICAERNHGMLINEIHETSFISKILITCSSDKNTDNSSKK